MQSGWRLIPILAASGFAGLGYEMVWTRLLSVALGTEMMAVLGSVAGFFAGLALGAFVLDRPIRRARSPHIVFAALESVIGLWGVISIWLLPAAGRALPPLLGVEPTPALLWAASFALPVVVLLPATAAMGGTLTALERMMSSEHVDTRVSAGVYGANTAGAVAGTLTTAFLLFPSLGLSGTLLCLAGLNALCAVSVIALKRTVVPVAPVRPAHIADQAPTLHASPHPSAANPDPPPEPARKPIRHIRLLVSLFTTGFLGVAFEVLVVRLAAQTMQDTIYTFAGLLAAYLLGTAAGGVVWQHVARHAPQDSATGWLLCGTALSCLTTAALAPFTPRIAEIASRMGVADELAVAIVLFVLPSAAMGALFGHLAQQVRNERGTLGWAVAINSLGAAVAPLATALVLIPCLGVWTALIPVALAYLLLLPLRRAVLVWAAAPLAAGLTLSVLPTPSLIRLPAEGRLLAVREGPTVTGSIVADASGARYLEVNGHFRMGGTNSIRSDYRQSILPLLLHPAPQRALFLGVGTGATLVGGARMPAVQVQGVELSPEVVALLPWFANPGTAPPTPPVAIADARRYVAADSRLYDVIIADLYHPALDGSGSLYTIEHFTAVRKRLARGGLFCQWLPLYQLDMPSLRAIIRSFLDVYPGGSAWLAHYSVRTPMLVLIGPRDGGHLDVGGLPARLDDPAIQAVTRPIGFEVPIDVLGQYVGGPRALRALAGDGPRNTDDYPFVTLDARRNVAALAGRPSAVLINVTRTVRPDVNELLDDAQRKVLGSRLTAYWQARNQFLESGAALQGDPRGLALVRAASPGLLQSIRLSAEFDPAYHPLISMARSLMASDRAAAAQLLQQINDAAPSRSEARELLSAYGVN